MKIHTQSGKMYIVNEKNQIIRTDMEFTPSDSWKFVGFQDRWNHYVHIDKYLYGHCKYKNGKGKYFLVDNDHGTWRQWSDRIIAIYE